MGHRVGNVIAAWIQAVSSRPWWFILLACALAGVSLTYAIDNLRINTDTVDMFSAQVPFRQTYENYKREFPQYVDTLLIVIDSDVPELSRDAATRLAQRLRDSGAQFKTLYAPGISEFFERHALLYMDVAELEDQADTMAAVQPFLGRLTQDHSLRGLLSMLGSALEAVQDGESVDLEPMLERLTQAFEANLQDRDYRLSWQELMLTGEASPQDRRQYIVVQPELDFGKLLPAAPAVDKIRQLAKELDLTADQGLRLRITGDVALEYEEMQSVSRGAGVAALAALAMVLIVLAMGLRSSRLVIATLATLLAGLTLTAGFAAAAVGELNLISIAFAVLYIGLGVDFGIHLCLRYQELVRGGEPSEAALLGSARDVGASLVLCALTTAVGFYAFIPTAFAGVSALGLISGTGMFISLAVTLTLLPALLSVWPLQNTPIHKPSQANRLLTGFSELPYKHGTAVRRSALVLAVAGLFALPLARFDYNPLNLRDPASESVSTFKDLLANSSTPPWSASVLATSAAATLENESRLRSLKTVGKVVALEDFVPEEQDDKLTIVEDLALVMGPVLDDSAGKPPPSYDQQRDALREFQAGTASYLASSDELPWRETISRLHSHLERLQARLNEKGTGGGEQQLARLQHGLLEFLPHSLHLLRASLGTTGVTLEGLPGELVERWLSKDGTYRIAVFPKADISDNAALRRFVLDVRSVAPDATDAPVVSLEAGNVAVAAFQQAFAGALIAIIVILGLILRKVRDTLLVLVPLLLAGVLITAVLVASGGAFNFANIIALPLLLGIGVDSGIHVIHRVRSSGSQRTNLLTTSTARAVFFSALTTIVSFGNLGFSTHPGTASMGRLLTLGVLLTLISTLVVLPALIDLRHPRPDMR